MINLRQGRRRQTVFSVCRATSLTAAAALAGVLLLPVPAQAAPHSHAHRVLPTALHSSTITETGTHATKKGKRGIKSKVDAEPEGPAPRRGAGAKSQGKQSKAHGRHSEPVDDVVPMFRAERGGQRRGSKTAQAAVNTGRGKRRGGFSAGPAPLVSRDSRGRGHMLASGNTARRHPAGEDYAAARSASPHLSTPNRGVTRFAQRGPARDLSPAVNQDYRKSPPSTVASVSHTASRPEAYAQGVSQPDDDERLPRAQGKIVPQPMDEAGEDAPAPIIRAAGPPQPTAPVLPKPGVVQGFGSEVAVPSPDGATRPGGTHRRNHPANWTDSSAVLPAEPLEEREAITDLAVSPTVLPEIYDRNGRLLMPAPLKGSHEVLVHQNLMGTSDGLERIHDDADLDRLRAAHLLVNFPLSDSLHVNEDLPPNRRVARPWTAMFAGDLAHAFYARFREPIYVTSAVRTVNYQARLQRINGNAAATAGEAASPHLTGQAVDLGKRGMTSAQLAWMRDYLLPLMQAGKIDVEEEFQQACFHVSVYRSYAAGRRSLSHEVAQMRTVAPVVLPGSGAEPEDK